jgi:hypothetical protein
MSGKERKYKSAAIRLDFYYSLWVVLPSPGSWRTTPMQAIKSPIQREPSIISMFPQNFKNQIGMHPRVLIIPSRKSYKFIIIQHD